MSDGPPISYESWATAVERYELLRVEADALRSQVERLAHAMLDSDMPRWDADRLVIEQGWNTPDRCGRCGEVNPQVERYREALERITSTVAHSPRPPIVRRNIRGIVDQGHYDNCAPCIARDALASEGSSDGTA